MVPPRDEQEAADDPDKEAELLSADTPDLAYAEPADDTEAGAGVFKKSIEGYRDHGARSRLFSERGNRMCALPVPQKVLSQINVSYPACALTLVGNFSL